MINPNTAEKIIVELNPNIYYNVIVLFLDNNYNI